MIAPIALALATCAAPQVEAPRPRDLGIVIGSLPTGPLNAITDVAGVAVGHCTLVAGDSVRTGVTVVHPCLGESAYLRKLPAAVATGNGYGKAAGFTQVQELGELEAPIALTNTLAVGAVLDAMVARCLAEPGMEDVRSINVVVGETNDGRLNDIRGRHVGAEQVAAAFEALSGGAVLEGAVGAGTGTVCFGWKGGMGTSSRVVESGGRWTVGVLVQTNFGGSLRVDGRPLPEEPDAEGGGDGSCMIILATDAPLDARNLERLARRTFLGLARTGSVLSNGSGDYALAFSTCPANRIPAGAREPLILRALPNASLTPLFQAAVEATEEAVLGSLVSARTTTGRGFTVRALPHDLLRRALGTGK